WHGLRSSRGSASNSGGDLVLRAQGARGAAEGRARSGGRGGGARRRHAGRAGRRGDAFDVSRGFRNAPPEIRSGGALGRRTYFPRAPETPFFIRCARAPGIAAYAQRTAFRGGATFASLV